MYLYPPVHVLVTVSTCTRISLYVYSYQSVRALVWIRHHALVPVCNCTLVSLYMYMIVLVSICTCTLPQKKNTHVTLVLYNFVRIPIYVSSFNIQNVYYAIGL